MGNYMSPKELAVVQRLCKAVSDLYEAQDYTEGVLLDMDDGSFSVLDGNGESLGTIGMMEDGKFGLYFPENSGEKK